MEPIYFNPLTDKRPSGGFCRGDRIRVLVGVEVSSTHPSRKRWTTRRSQVVRVAHELAGRYVTVQEVLDEHSDALIKQGFDLSKLEAWKRDNSMEFYRMMVCIDPPSVRWAGAGGYWCEVPVNAVERIAA